MEVKLVKNRETKKMKLKVIMAFLAINGWIFSQQSLNKDTTIFTVQEFEEFYVPQNFNRQYRTALRRVRRVYPLALHAAHIIDSLENAIANEEKTRKQKKIARQTHRDLKNDFKYLLKELYVSEGVVLSKLIYRETGMSVAEIIEKYKSGTQASLYTGLASFFDQELDATYDPIKEDFVLECVIQDIKAGKVDFDPDFEIVDKEHYKKDRAEYKARIKASKKKQRKEKREKRRAKRKSND